MPILKIAQTVDGTPRAWEVEVGDRETTVGRDKGCAIPLDDKAVSRNHARLLPTAQGFLLRDLGSSNGTWVNGQRVTEVILKDGDEIRIGGCAIRFVLPPDQAKTVMLGAEALKSYLPPPVPQPPPHPAAYAPPPAAQPHAPPPPSPAYAPPPPPAPPQQYAPPPPVYAPPPPPAVNYPTPPLPPVVQPAYPPPPPRPRPMHAAPPPAYAGFWIRFLAYLLDSVILGFALGIIMIPGMVVLSRYRYDTDKLILGAVVVYGLASLLGLFYILFFWAVKGGTPGKKALGLRIIREDGVEPLGWGTACMRLLGYLVDGFTFYIGFIMIAFTDRKRGLHDMIAGTTVVKIR